MYQAKAAVGRVGRARDSSIDERVLEVAGRQLAEVGFEAMSMAGIARAAGTTRQAIYRRWPSKSQLATAVIGHLPQAGLAPRAPEQESPFVDPFGDLVAELADFAAGVSGPGRLFLVGTMLQDTTDASVQERYRNEIVVPRNRRLREILEQAIALELIDADADLDVAVTLGTGSWYAGALAGDPAPPQWPVRAATLLWRSVGGTPPLSSAAPASRLS
ncbi:MAG TPA: TetR/AcrR family transcriptional regulator [Propionibacteriaceae bacterium]|nr:TetR/AcrR family transcriptional regulator [Propionibacteriaceae bacterium]